MEWIKDTVIYNIYPLGFCGALYQNDFKQEYRLDKIYDFIPHFKKMGVNAVLFNPLFESSYHGYDTIDYYKVDSRLGDNESFKKICDTLHENGIRVILDAVFNHVGREHFAFKDVQQNRENSQYCSWFNCIDFGGNTDYNDGFYYEGWSGFHSLVKLNLHNEDVINHLLGALSFWMDEFKIDGIRLDAADVMDFNFFRRLRDMAKSKNPDFWMYGEIVGGDYNRWANNDMLDSVTNYELFKPIFSSHNDNNYFEFAHSVDREFGDWGMYKNLYLYNFIDNHDVNRIASNLNDKSKIYNCYTMLYTVPGIPTIYYGSEFGIEGSIKESDTNVRKELNLNNLENPNYDLLNHICKLSKIKHTLEAFKYGKYKNEVIQLDHLCYSMKTENQAVYILLNQSNDNRTISFNTFFNGYLTDVLNGNQKYECHDYVSIDIKPKSSMILIANDGSFAINFDEEEECQKVENTQCENNNFELPEQEITLGKYRHFKGNEYEVIGFAIHSETNEKMVIYKALYGDYETFVRPYDMFKEIIERDGKKLYRFERI